MESKNITIICAWTFLFLLWILSYLGNWNLFLPLMLSFIILVISIGMSFAPSITQSDAKSIEGIEDLKSKLEETTKDVEKIKKIIEK